MKHKHIVSASVVVLDRDKNILLVKGPKRGWELPGGQVEHGEKILDALMREVHEETKAEIKEVSYRGLFHNIAESTVNLLFLAEYGGGKLSKSKESLDVAFFKPDEVSKLVTYSNFFKRIEHVLFESSPFMVEF